jgi:hypothetical protein
VAILLRASSWSRGASGGFLDRFLPGITTHLHSDQHTMVHSCSAIVTSKINALGFPAGGFAGPFVVGKLVGQGGYVACMQTLGGLFLFMSILCIGEGPLRPCMCSRRSLSKQRGATLCDAASWCVSPVSEERRQSDARGPLALQEYGLLQ